MAEVLYTHNAMRTLSQLASRMLSNFLLVAPVTTDYKLSDKSGGGQPTVHEPDAAR